MSPLCRIGPVLAALALGHPAFAQPSFAEQRLLGSPAPYAYGLAVADLDGDSDPDVATAPWGGTVQAFLNDGDGGFTELAGAAPPHSVFTTALVAGDTDGDGDVDLAVASFGRPLEILVNRGDGSFAAGALRAEIAEALALGDLDGDGDLDLALTRAHGPSEVLRNDGRGAFTSGPRFASLPGALHLRLADVDGDGDPDLLAAQRAGVRLLVNDGRAQLTPARPGSLPDQQPANGRDVAAGDLDGDGDLDLAVIAADRVEVWRNDGHGRFAPHGGGGAAAVPLAQAVGLGDADLDGDLDVAAGTWSTERLHLLLNDGTGALTDASARLPADLDANLHVRFVDLDRDGDPELIAGNGFTGVTRTGTRVYTNLHAQATAAGPPPAPGGTLRVDVHHQPGYAASPALALPWMARGRAQLAVPPLGVLGLELATLIAGAPLLLPAGGGVATAVFTVPALPALAGNALHAQALLVPFAGTARLTNVTSAVVGTQ